MLNASKSVQRMKVRNLKLGYTPTVQNVGSVYYRGCRCHVEVPSGLIHLKFLHPLCKMLYQSTTEGVSMSCGSA